MFTHAPAAALAAALAPALALRARAGAWAATRDKIKKNGIYLLRLLFEFSLSIFQKCGKIEKALM